MTAISLNAPPIRGHGPLLHLTTIFENQARENSQHPSPRNHTHPRPPKHAGAGHDRDFFERTDSSRAWPAPTS